MQTEAACGVSVYVCDIIEWVLKWACLPSLAALNCERLTGQTLLMSSFSALFHTHTRSHTHTSLIHSTLKRHCSHWGSLFPKAPSQTLLFSYVLLLFQRVRVHVRVVVRATRADVSSPRVHHSFNTSQQVRLRNS